MQTTEIFLTRVLKLFLLIGALTLAFFFSLLGTQRKSISPRWPADHQLAALSLNGELLTVEMVNTPTSIQQGLSGRESLDVDGMLFMIDPPTQATFWMKGMVMPIDIIWLYKGKIVGFERNVPPPPIGTMDQALERYVAPQLVDMVLETAPGRLSLH